jgi:hypothetical protein
MTSSKRNTPVLRLSVRATSLSWRSAYLPGGLLAEYRDRLQRGLEGYVPGQVLREREQHLAVGGGVGLARRLLERVHAVGLRIAPEGEECEEPQVIDDTD